MRPRLYNIAHTSPISAKRATRGFKIGPLRKRNPGRRLRRCARAASGHAAAPPSSVMNWRRLRSSMGSSPEPAVPAYRRLRMPRKRPAGPWREGVVLYTSTWPGTNVFMPAVSTSWTCTKTSGPPSSGRMKPNPRSVLKNFTRPVGIFSCLSSDRPSAPATPTRRRAA